MTLLTAAIDNHDVADFLGNMLTVFIIVIFIRILASWLPRRPVSGPLKAILDFCEQTADPYLNIFRSFIKPIGGGAVSLDLSPIIGVLVLVFAGGFLVSVVDRL
ncbi:MAG: YggT family protein [Solirubrobacterales bacterium]